MKANKNIRDRIEKNNIKYWQVALQYGVSDVTFSKKLRIELKDSEKVKINSIIDKLIKEKKED